jgi:tetrapyrrole methylase family protein/MazG family protein
MARKKSKQAPRNRTSRATPRGRALTNDSRRSGLASTVSNAKHAARGNKQRPAPSRRRAGTLFEALIRLQARLRAPNGCPWDREQTHDSLRTYLVEETYEVLDALDSGDPHNIAGELGDLLLQIVFHSQLAQEAGQFDIRDVIEHVHTKMVRRHPHVFGSAKASTSAQVLKNWEALKAEERAAAKNETDMKRRNSGKVEQQSILAAVPRTLPALLEAHQLTRRAANVGFDWPDINGVLDKLSEEVSEVREALSRGDRSHIEEELGDLLFVCVNLARFLKLDAEIALKKANHKFKVRFAKMESATQVRGKQLSKCSAEELDQFWNEAKIKSNQTH